jgi:glyoxylase-like metal-dependent hydrolase (beta-lactamase superfamily II)
MQQLTSNVFIETQVKGCNFGYVTTADGIVMLDSPHKPSDAMKLKAEIASRGPLRYIINTEPHGDHWTGNAFFDVPAIAHAGVRQRILATDMAQHIARVASFGPDEPRLLEGYTPNVPVITFEHSMTLHVGDHTFQMLHMPGHTLYQAAILIKEEGVVFTSDNIFYKVQTFIQEANPDQWLQALESLRKLDEEVFVPGHGAVCDKRYLDEQGAYITEWKAYVQQAIDRGMSKDDAVDRLTAMTDRYPMDVGLEGQAPRVMRMNVANLYDYLTGTGIHSPGASRQG